MRIALIERRLSEGYENITEMAKAINVSDTYYGDLERETRNPSVITTLKIMDKLNVEECGQVFPDMVSKFREELNQYLKLGLKDN